MSAYAARASAIRDITTDLRHRMEITSVCGTVADKATVVDLGIEIINKILTCFRVFPDTQVGDSLNALYRSMQSCAESVTRVFYELMSVVRAVEKKAIEWVGRYCK